MGNTQAMLGSRLNDFTVDNSATNLTKGEVYERFKIFEALATKRCCLQFTNKQHHDVQK